MALVSQIAGLTGTLADVDSTNNAMVNLPVVVAEAGFASVAAESDDGTVTGTRAVRKGQMSEQGRLAVGVDTMLFNENHYNNVLNTGQWNTPVLTSTVTVVSGSMTLTGNTTTVTHARATSWRQFPLRNRTPLKGEIAAQFAIAPQANNTVEWGFLIGTGTTAPTDGCFFRFTSTGTFVCVNNFNGTEVVSANLTAATLVGTNTVHDFQVIINDDDCEFFIDGTRVARIARQTAAPSMCLSQTLPIAIRQYNSVSVPAGTQVVKVGSVSVLLGDENTGKTFADVQSGLGLHGSQGQLSAAASYAIPATTAVYSNNLATAAGTAASNTAAIATGIGLGGQVVVLPTLAAATDGIIFSYQNPAGTTTQPGRNLYVNGVTVDGIVSVVLAGGPVYWVWAVAYGHTAVSLATAEAGNTATPTKKARLVPFGISSTVVTAAVGTQFAKPVTLTLRNPIMVAPGEFFQITAKNIGTVTTTGAIVVTATIDSYWE
jgi:hypothetical protein